MDRFDFLQRKKEYGAENMPTQFVIPVNVSVNIFMLRKLFQGVYENLTKILIITTCQSQNSFTFASRTMYKNLY